MSNELPAPLYSGEELNFRVTTAGGPVECDLVADDENRFKIRVAEADGGSGWLFGYLSAADRWAAYYDDRGQQTRLGLITKAALYRHCTAEHPDWELLTNELTGDDWRVLGAGIAAAVMAGDGFQPAPTGDFPGVFDYPDVEPWKANWETSGEVLLSIVGPDGPDDPLGPFSVSFVVGRQHASWYEWFQGGGMGGDAPTSGWAAWTDDCLLIAGECPDLEDNGYMCFRLAQPVPLAGTPAFDRWRAALARLIILRPSDPLDNGYSGFTAVE